jgi:YVTN family beta-propeller protein
VTPLLAAGQGLVLNQGRAPSADSAVIAFSTDYGSTWLRQGATTQPGRRYDWNVPYLPTGSGRVRVTEWYAQDTYVGAGSRFTVYDTLPPSRATITAPALDTVWPEAGLRRITWTGGTDGLDSAVVFFSPDNRANWTRQGRSTTPGSHLWRVSGPATTQAFIRVIFYCLTRRDSATSFRFTVTEATYPDSVIATITQDSAVSPRAMVWDSIDNLVYVANLRDSSVIAIDSDNAIRATMRTGPFPVALAWNARQNRLYAACSLGGVTVINCATNTVIKTIAAGARPTALCWNATSNKVYCVNNQDSSLTIIDAGTDSVLVHRRVGAGPVAVSWHPTLNRVYVANSAANTVSVIDGVTNAILATVPVGTGPAALVADDLYSQVFVINRGSSSVTVISSANTAFPEEFVPLAPQQAVWNPQQEKAYVTCAGGNQVGAVHAVTRQVETFFVGSQPRGLVWMPNPSRLYVANSGANTVSIVNCAANTVIKTLPVGRAPLAACYNPLTNRVYVANSGDGTITVIGR